MPGSCASASLCYLCAVDALNLADDAGERVVSGRKMREMGRWRCEWGMAVMKKCEGNQWSVAAAAAAMD